MLLIRCCVGEEQVSVHRGGGVYMGVELVGGLAVQKPLHVFAGDASGDVPNVAWDKEGARAPGSEHFKCFPASTTMEVID